MFDIGWMEMALIAVVAIVVIGPKDLPKVMREIGTWVARARAMSRVFMEQLDEMSRQSGIDEIRKEAEALRQLNPKSMIENSIDPDGVIARETANLAQLGESRAPPALEPTPSVAQDPVPVAEPPVEQNSDADKAGTATLPPRAPSESAP